MPWVRIDDGFVDHPKVARVGAIGAWLQLQALCYANRNLTDGFVPYGVAASFIARGTRRIDGDRVWRLAETCGMAGRDIDEATWSDIMVEAGLWERVAGGFRIHDFDHYQPTKAEVLAERARSATRQDRFRKRRHAVSNAVTTPVINAGPVPVSKNDTTTILRASRLYPRFGARARAREPAKPENAEPPREALPALLR